MEPPVDWAGPGDEKVIPPIEAHTRTPAVDPNPQQPCPEHGDRLEELLRGRGVAPAKPSEELGHLVSDLLLDRLDPQAVSAVERRVGEDPELAAILAQVEGKRERGEVLLQLAAWVDERRALERTGLVRFAPPQEVHAMARGPTAAAGGLYEANMVAEALALVGFSIGEVGAGLDFGCSSGRVLLPLYAAYPKARWLGCDPNQGAIEWARRTLPKLELFVSPQHPPLPIGDGELDLVFAISIWSHFGPDAAVRWWEEMARLVRPGGWLLFTTHGLGSIAYHLARGERLLSQSVEIAETLYRTGYWYRQEFGPSGDWGVKDPEWGTAFMTPEWVVSRLCPRWALRLYLPGRNLENQDLYLFQRL